MTHSVTRREIIRGVTASFGLAQFARGADFETVGRWTGLLMLGSQRMHLKFEITPDGAGSMYSLDQDNRAIPVKVTRNSPDAIEIAVKSIRGRFSGRAVSPDRIEGTWYQPGISPPLVLLRGDAGLADPGAPIEPLTADSLEQLRRAAGAPALAAAAIARGRATLSWVSGVRAIGSNAHATVNDLWHIGSITKSFTAMLVARLVEAGAISWTDTIADLLADIAPDARTEYRSASFIHLLSHRSGMPGDLPLPQYATFEASDFGDVRKSRARYARLALRMAPLGPKELTFSYSNDGYVVAAAMLEAKLSLSWESLLETHVFGPLGLKSAGFGAPGESLGLAQPLGHTSDLDTRLLQLLGGSGLKAVRPGFGRTDNARVLGPAGRVHLNVSDMLHVLSAHRDGTDFLAPVTWQKLHTPPFGGDYALGWFLRPDGTLWHNGSNNLWYAEVLVNKESGVAAFAVANEARSGAKTAVGQALLGAARAVS